MTVTVFTASPAPTVRPLNAYRPARLAELAERIAIEFAEQIRVKVLLITGVKPHLVMHSEIRRKPGAIQIENTCQNWGETFQKVKAFCSAIDDPNSRGYLMGVRRKAIVIINDADHFLAHGASDGLFTRTCDKELVNRVERMKRLVEVSGGELILMAILQSEVTSGWKSRCEELGWLWENQNQRSISRLRRTLLDGTRTDPKGYHEAGQEPPPEFPHGPLTGTKTELGRVLRDDTVEAPARRLDLRVKSGALWAKKVGEREYEIWFKIKRDFDSAQVRQRKIRGTI